MDKMLDRIDLAENIINNTLGICYVLEPNKAKKKLIKESLDSHLNILDLRRDYLIQNYLISNLKVK